MSSIDTDEFRGLLTEERVRVVGAIEHLQRENPGSVEDDTQELAAGFDNHPADLATETFDRELDHSLEENSEHVLSAINVALAKLDGGSYGTCERCGGQIAPDRLRAIPYATMCIDCRRREEQR